VVRASDAELEAHHARLQAIGAASADGCVWLSLSGEQQTQTQSGTA
jgi:hypothetical protein